MTKVFVYGTLKKGYPLDRGGQDKIEEAFLEGYEMFDLGAFPGIIPGDGIVKGEVHTYEDSGILRLLDMIECVPSLYRREEVETSVGSAFVYVYNNEPFGKKVESGEWS